MSVWNLFARSASRSEPKSAPRGRLQLEGLEVREVPAIAFVGGWGASMYQYASAGAADPVPMEQLALNFTKVVYSQPVSQSAPPPASDYLLVLDGVKGESRVELENVQITSYQLGAHGGAAGTTDDVVVDGRVITGENFDSATIANSGYIRIKKLNSGG